MVVRLIQVAYPSLVDHVIPLEAPREIAARELKGKYAQERGLKPEEIAAVSHPELGKAAMGQKLQDWYNAHPSQTTGWHPSCDHDAEPIPCVVLDPFAGSGTTLMVARQLGRSAIGLDLSFAYLKENATKRLELDKLKAWVGK